MNSKFIYICDDCGFENEDESRVRECEGTHQIPQRFNSVTIPQGAFNIPSQSYPDAVLVTFRDGAVGKYSRISITAPPSEEPEEEE
jgi:hypothetical protein